MKIHYYKPYHDLKKRVEIFPLLRPFLKINPIADSNRKTIYHISEKEVDFVELIEDAGICILTMSWNYYIAIGKIELAKQYIKEANKVGKKVWTWMSGDFGVELTLSGDYLVFRNSGLKSKLPALHVGMPVFIKDPLPHIYSKNTISFPDYQVQPQVGFCGQANAGVVQWSKEIAIRLKQKIKYKLRVTADIPQPIQSTSLIRANLLHRLEQNSQVKCNFIKRKKYRAGIKGNTRHQHQSINEFFDNIKASQYVLCFRGGGNFSVRFYETLAMGRIPIFVNTDCLLPLEDSIDWKKHCVWVGFEDRKQIAEKVIAFHQKHTAESLHQLMYSNRYLWESKLSMKNFFKEIYLNT
jgi:hypothetical protein